MTRFRFVFTLSLLSCMSGCIMSPSHDSDLSKSRFKFNQPASFDNDSYFFDRVSGNTWRKCDLGKKYSATERKCIGSSIVASWPEAVAIVQRLNEQNFEGSNDWHLPTRVDLANLLLNNPSFKEIKSMRHAQYGFGESDWYAYYENNQTINYGGFKAGYGGPGESQCRLAGQILATTFGNINEVELYSAYDLLPPKRNYRWLSDNYDWSNGQKAPLENNDWQSPHSFQFTMSCTNILTAFYKDSSDIQLGAHLVSHAEIPITIVRGRTPQEWIDAQVAIKNIQTIIELSRKRQNSRLSSITAFYTAIGDKVKDSFAGASVSSNPSSGSSKRYSCSFLCSGSLYATGSRHTIDAFGSNETNARESVKGQAEQICVAENRNKSGAWWADMSLCKEK